MYLCHFCPIPEAPLLVITEGKTLLNIPWFLFQVCEYPDGTKSLKLGDFGLATVVEGPLYTVCGTPTYVAPEIIAETGYASWGVGLVLELWEQVYLPRLLLWTLMPPGNMGGGRG